MLLLGEAGLARWRCGLAPGGFAGARSPASYRRLASFGSYLAQGIGAGDPV